VGTGKYVPKIIVEFRRGDGRTKKTAKEIVKRRAKRNSSHENLGSGYTLFRVFSQISL